MNADPYPLGHNIWEPLKISFMTTLLLVLPSALLKNLEIQKYSCGFLPCIWQYSQRKFALSQFLENPLI